MTTVTLSEWEHFTDRFPEANLLQCGSWGELKRDFGWQVERICQEDAGAQVLFRRLPGGFSVAYIPKGPVGAVKQWPALWAEIHRVCRQHRALLLKVEPDLNEPLPAEQQRVFSGFVPSGTVQPRRTIVVSLAGDEESWLAAMRQKTRYNIRLAERKGVQVRPSTDLQGFYRLMLETGKRDGFGIHDETYYRRAFELFHERGKCELLVAEYEGRLLAGLMVFASGKRSWYLFGASNEEERNRMPTYLLQYEAMRWAARQGCIVYDLVGAPDEDEEVLERDFSTRSDGLWGVYRFKRGFGGQLVRSAGAWDHEYLPLAGWLYRWYTGRRRSRGGGVE